VPKTGFAVNETASNGQSDRIKNDKNKFKLFPDNA